MPGSALLGEGQEIEEVAMGSAHLDVSQDATDGVICWAGSIEQAWTMTLSVTVCTV